MKCVLIATFVNEPTQYVLRDADGTLFILNGDTGSVLVADYQTEDAMREFLTHLCWNVRTVTV
jgi:hypothetical protein